MSAQGLGFNALQEFSARAPELYWAHVIESMGIVFEQPPEQVLSENDGVWLPGASMNIVASLFEGRSASELALLRGRSSGETESWSRAELKDRAGAVAQGLLAQGFMAGDAIAIDMPMSAESVAIYLGIIWMGAEVVSIADSFAAEEIRIRLSISQAKAVFTQDIILRGERVLPLYSRVVDAAAPRIIVLPAQDALQVELRRGDVAWDDFLAGGLPGHPDYHFGPANRCSNILFSSGTTGKPKAIPWTHITPIKAAGDAWAHHDVQPQEMIVWPTNLGWMMGPWLIYAGLLNGAAIGLFEGSPLGLEFGQFIERAKVNMLGVVPSLVKAWRTSGLYDDLDWGCVRRFSSTGEASNPGDMAWLMQRGGGVPVIEYCGGTEIGGGYLCGSMVQEQRAGQFSCPAMGTAFYLLDDEGKPASAGELALVSPMLGASTSLLNKDHEAVYFTGMPSGPVGERLRRHGDYIERLDGGYYRAHGRVDDTMNLGGIKVSSAAIERLVERIDAVLESAAVALSPAAGGPSELVLVVVLRSASEPSDIMRQAQRLIRSELNPLFKVGRVLLRASLPRTASNKVMRRVLRAELQEQA
jgi:acetyl-CoA synthetase